MSQAPHTASAAGPLEHLDDWEQSLAVRYPEHNAADSAKPAEAFRDYAADVRPTVREFYRLNHRYQTLDFVREKKQQYLPLHTKRMGHLGGDGVSQ